MEKVTEHDDCFNTLEVNGSSVGSTGSESTPESSPTPAVPSGEISADPALEQTPDTEPTPSLAPETSPADTTTAP